MLGLQGAAGGGLSLSLCTNTDCGPEPLLGEEPIMFWPAVHVVTHVQTALAPDFQVQKAVEDGYDVRGFMYWTLVDK